MANDGLVQFETRLLNPNGMHVDSSFHSRSDVKVRLSLGLDKGLCMNWTYRLITHQYIDYQVAFDRKASEVLIPVLLSHRERVRSRTYIKSGHVIHRENNQQGKQVFYGSSITVVTMTSSDSIDPLAPWRNSDYRMDLAGTKYAHWYFNKIHLEEIVTGYHYLRRQR